MRNGSHPEVRPLGRPTLKVIGEDYFFSYPEGVEIEMRNVVESKREGVHAEVLVSAPGAGKVAWGQVKLDSADMRDRFATKASKLVPNFQWSTAMTQTAMMATETLRKGEPVLNFANPRAPQTSERFLIKPFLPVRQTTIVFGDGGLGKSLFALWLGVCASHGVQIPNGEMPATPVNVLYLDWELSFDNQEMIVHRLLSGIGKTGSPNMHYRRMWRSITGDFRAVAKAVADHNVKLVVIDSLGYAVGDDLNEAAAAIKTMNALRNLNVTVLALAHVSKLGIEDQNRSASPFGSRYFHNGARCTWELKRTTDGGHYFVLENRKMNIGPLVQDPIAFKVEYSSEGGPISFSEAHMSEGSLKHLDKPSNRIYMFLSEEGPSTVNAISEALGLSKEVTRATLNRDRRVGVYEKGGPRRGSLWAVVDKEGESLL